MRLTGMVVAMVCALLALLALPQIVRANGTGEMRLMMVPKVMGQEQVAPIMNLKLQRDMMLPLLGGVSMHADWRHAMDRGTWCENRVIVGATKPLFGGLDMTADYERKYNTNISRVWLSVGMPFRL